MQALEARALTFRYPRAERPALERLSLTVGEGSFTGLLGPNGAGKSTFCHLVSGLLRPDSGRLTVFGHDAGRRAAQRALGLCPQELALYPTLSARENLRFFGRLSGLRGRRLAERVDACLGTASLTAEAATRVERFSGGMKRRLNLAVALLHEPRLLLLDEPTAGVDAQSRLAIFETLEELAAAGATILYTSHYMEEVERLCGEVIVIDHGRTLRSGKTAAIVQEGRRAQSIRIALAPGARAEDVVLAAVREGLRARELGSGELELAGDDPAALLAELARLAERGEVASYETHRPSLEETFLELTGRDLRE